MIAVRSRFHIRSPNFYGGANSRGTPSSANSLNIYDAFYSVSKLAPNPSLCSSALFLHVSDTAIRFYTQLYVIFTCLNIFLCVPAHFCMRWYRMQCLSYLIFNIHLPHASIPFYILVLLHTYVSIYHCTALKKSTPFYTLLFPSNRVYT